MSRIVQDQARFRERIRKACRRDLQRIITDPSVVTSNEWVDVSLGLLNIPRFYFDHTQVIGIGQGDGEVGDVISEVEPGLPGELPTYPVQLSMLTELLGEELGLEPIQREECLKFGTDLEVDNVGPVGPQSLIDKRRTIKNSIRRMSARGGIQNGVPFVIEPRDKRYRTTLFVPEPEVRNVAIFICDVSSRMREEEILNLPKTLGFWVKKWMKQKLKC